MGEAQKQEVTHQDSRNPELKYSLQPKTKEDIGSSGLRLSKGRKAIHMDMKSQYFVNKCFLGHICRHRKHRNEF